MARLAQPLSRPSTVAGSSAMNWWKPSTIWRVLAYVALGLAVVLVGLPIYWMLLAAFKTNQEIFTAPPTWIPLAPTLQNFPAAWNQAPFGHFYINSIIYTVVSGGVKLLQAIFCAYAFAYLRFPYKNVLFVL